MKKILFSTLALLPWFACEASVIFTQPHNGSGALYQSSVNGTDYDQMTWDLFRVTNATAITEIHWRGGYIYGGAYSGVVTNWTIAIYRDIANGFQPDIINPPFVAYTISGNAGETPAGNFGGTAMFDYAVTLPSPFPVAAGSNYWLLIRANQIGIPEWGIALGSGGDGGCFRRVAAAADWWFYRASGDTAFTLFAADGPTVLISASASPAGSGEIIGAGNYPAGSLATLTALPAANFGFVNWTENGATVSAASSYQFTANADRALVANFTPRYVINVSASPNYGGAVIGGGTFNSNAIVTVMAIPSAGYAFANWTEFGVEVSTLDTFTFNIAGNRTLVANFVSVPATATFDFDTGMPPVYAHQGLPASQWNNGLTAYFTTLSGGWFVDNNFYYWVPGVFSGNFLYPTTLSGSTLAIQFSAPVTNVSIAFFTGDVSSEYDIPTKVRITAFTNSALTNPVASAVGQGDWLTGAYPEGTMSLASAVPFTNIKIDMPPGQGAVSYCFWLDNIVAQQIVQPPATIAASAWPTNGGVITGDGTYASGAIAVLSAMANAGFAFTNWTENGAEVCITPDYTFTATNDRALVANFVLLPPTFDIVLGALPSNGGSVSGSGIFTNGENVTISATANSGYDFIAWTENGAQVNTSTNYNFSVTTNRVLIASFAAAVIPQLIIQTAAGVVVLSWPTNSIGFTLEQNTNLASPSWTAVTNAVGIGGINNQVTLSPAGATCFYRLVHP